MAFYRLQTELAKEEEALRVGTVKVVTLWALLEFERYGFTSSSMMKRELVCLRYSHDKLREIARDLGFDATGLLCTHAHDGPIFHTRFGRLF